MATKAELRQSYVDAGWTVQQVSNWGNPVSSVEGVVKYDVNVVSPENRFFTAQVIVTDDGGPAENAVPYGGWVEQPETFTDALRDHIRTVETNVATIFAIAVKEVFAEDEVAEAKAYMTDGSVSTYVVKRRGGTFSQEELV